MAASSTLVRATRTFPTPRAGRTVRTSVRLVTAGLLAGALLGPTAAEAAPTAPVVASSGITSLRPGVPGSTSPVAPAAPTVRATASAVATIRATAAAKGVALGTLDVGQRIPTLADPVKGWVEVRFHTGRAYVALSQLRLAGVGVEPARPATLSTSGTKIATAKLVVRSAAAKSASSVGRINEGRPLTLTGPVRNGYAQTKVAKKLRWVSVRYLASQAPAQTALDFARAQLGKPYKFGAEGPKAFDCSGLTQSSWAAAGVAIPRTAAQQSRSGTKVTKAKLQPGDLVFFYGKTPSHVAIYVGEGLVIHSPRPGKKVEYIKMAYMPYSKARRYR
ncbi:C40 family peptidase [uncultured Friedmanniella sp.]|uniref:C40 family peptidase n=1 Tax=uncultured Friedmanniella sp. TaxID=335381 RepID=UPI0035CBB38B